MTRTGQKARTVTRQIRRSELEAIVAALAKDDPIELVGSCPWCSSDGVHFEGCVWRRARKARRAMVLRQTARTACPWPVLAHSGNPRTPGNRRCPADPPTRTCRLPGR